MDDLLPDFLAETTESLAELDLALVKLEKEPNDPATLSLIFRLVHTIKGTCGFIGLPRLEQIAHAGENVLSKVRDGTLAVTPKLVTAILSVIDHIKLITAALGQSGKEPAGDDSSLIALLGAICRQDSHDPGGAPGGTPVASPVEPGLSPVPQAGAEQIAASQTIRVGVAVLDQLMALASELVLTRNQLLQLSRSGAFAELASPLQSLSQITTQLQEGVMKIRMQPIGHAWNQLPRLVRELSHELGKKIDLVMTGGDTELDRQVLELIKDPLTHMIRNSADHGLEPPAERRAAGKPETGLITLHAYHDGGHIVIDLSDDGRGLQTAKIKAAARARGLASEAELAALSPDAIQHFIFRPGFSTAAAITEISGRGVGMDVVKTNIEKIGGTIGLRSRAGNGAEFSVKIPLTLAIVAALIVEVGGERFAIPQINVVELVRARESGGRTHDLLPPQETSILMIERINDAPVLRLRERLLPLIDLAVFLELQSGKVAQEPCGRNHTIIVTQVGASIFGLIVDGVFDTEEIVVKPMAPLLRDLSMFSGNTTLGDGSVILILDPNGIARATGIASAAADHEAAIHSATRHSADEEPTKTLLQFRAGNQQIKAIPLELVARLENIQTENIEYAASGAVTQFRDRLMPLIALSGVIDAAKTAHPVLVFTNDEDDHARHRCMGLIVDEIIDIVESKCRIDFGGLNTGILGSAIIAGRATDVLDLPYWLTRARHDWFATDSTRAARPGNPHHRILIVEDSVFFRQMMVPVLRSAGYDVVAIADAARALELRESGDMFDAIISDIKMPGMDGLAFIRTLRASGPWMHLPVIALSGHATADDIDRGRDAGFTDYIAKFAREELLLSLRQCLSQPVIPENTLLRVVA